MKTKSVSFARDLSPNIFNFRNKPKSVKMKSNLKKLSTKCEVLNALWPLLFLGKIFGMIHLRRLPTNSSSIVVVHTSKSCFTLVTIILLVTYVTVVIFSVIIFIRQIKSADTNLVEQFLDLIYQVHVTLTLTFAVYQSKNFPELFADWFKLESQLGRLETLVDFPCCKLRGHAWEKGFKKLRVVPAFIPSGPFFIILKPFRHLLKTTRRLRTESDFVLTTWILIGGYFTLAMIGALAYFGGVAVREKSPSVKIYLETVAEIYILQEYSNWLTGLFIILMGHVMELTWAFGDMLIFFFSFTLKYHYGRFNKILEVIKLCHPSVLELELLRAAHWDVAMGIKKADECLGLITTTSFTCNILYLFSRVYLGLAEDLSSPQPSIVFEASFAFTYLIGRIFGSALMASSLNAETNRTLSILMQFADKELTEDHFLMMERFCTQVITGNVAFTGKGYFVLNRNFIVSLVSAIATYEIIIIQFSAS